jgi:hypothetical protein
MASLASLSDNQVSHTAVPVVPMSGLVSNSYSRHSSKVSVSAWLRLPGLPVNLFLEPCRSRFFSFPHLSA